MGMGGPAYGRGVPSITDCCRRTQDIQKTVLSKLMELYRSPIGDGSRGQNWTSSEDVEHDFFEPRIFQQTTSKNQTGKLNLEQEVLSQIKTDLIWFGAYTPSREQKTQQPKWILDLGIIYQIDQKSKLIPNAQNVDPQATEIVWQYEQIQIRVVGSTETKQTPNGTSYESQIYKEQVTINQVFSSQCDSLKNLSPAPKFHKSLVTNILLNQQSESTLPDNCF